MFSPSQIGSGAHDGYVLITLGGVDYWVDIKTLPTITSDSPLSGAGTSASHLVITPDATHRWLTDTLTSTWNAKQDGYANLTSIGGLANGAGWLHNDGAGAFAYSTPSATDVGLGNVTNNAQIYSLNGLTAQTQTFGAIGTSGTAPAWTSTTSTHTLNIPMAATAGVTAGLISKTQYDVFNGKQAALSFANLTGTTNQVSLSASGTGVLVGSTNIQLSLPQDIAITSSPQFANMGIAHSSVAGTKLYIYPTIQHTDSASSYNIQTILYGDQTADSTNAIINGEFETHYNINGNSNTSYYQGVIALDANSNVNGTGTLKGATSIRVQTINSGAGTVTNAYGIYFLPINNSGAGTITNAYGIYLNGFGSNTGTVTNTYGLYINDQTLAGATAYNIYSAGAGTNYFGGSLKLAGGNSIYPSADSTTALYINKADNATHIVTIDSTNGRMGVGVTPTAYLDIQGLTTGGGNGNVASVSLQLRNGNNAGSYTSNQIAFGYYNTDTYRHGIKTTHDAFSTTGNTLGFYLWNYGVDASTAIGTKQVMTLNGAGNVGIGTAAPATALHIIKTTEQLRLGYDASNYLSATVASTGSVTLALTGTSPIFTFSQNVVVPDMKATTYHVGADAGADGTFTTVDLKTVTVKKGIITSIV